MNMNLYNIYKNKTDSWFTPKNIYDSFVGFGFKDFNVLNDNYKNSFLLSNDDYFCNPPFSNIEPFVDYMINNSKNGYRSVMLLPIRLCTSWFKKLLCYGCDFILLGRIAYSSKGLAPFDSMLVYLSGVSPSSFYFNKQYKERSNFGGYVQYSIFDMGVN